jgi:hypothetical protein
MHRLLAGLLALGLAAAAAPVPVRAVPDAPASQDTLRFARTDTAFVPIPPGGAWPARFDVGIVVLRGADGVVEALQEEPQSESGDWSLAYRHTFDARGRTTRYESTGQFFGGDCGAGVVLVRLAITYDSTFRVTGREHTYRDPKGAPVDSVACGKVYAFFDGDPAPSYPALVERGRAPRRLP